MLREKKNLYYHFLKEPIAFNCGSRKTFALKIWPFSPILKKFPIVLVSYPDFDSIYKMRVEESLS